MTDRPTDIVRPAEQRPGLRMPLGRRGWLILGATIMAAGSALNWGWLTAIGAAPLILALAPCAVMCGLGLCMMGDKKGCATDAKNKTDTTGTEKAGN